MTRANVGPRPYCIATGFGAAWTGTATGASVDRIDAATRTVRERVAFPCPGSITPAGDGFWVTGTGADGPMSVFFEPVGA